MTGEEYLYLVKHYGVSVTIGQVPNAWAASAFVRHPNGTTRTETAIGATPEQAMERLARRYGWLAAPSSADFPLLAAINQP